MTSTFTAAAACVWVVGGHKGGQTTYSSRSIAKATTKPQGGRHDYIQRKPLFGCVNTSLGFTADANCCLRGCVWLSTNAAKLPQEAVLYCCGTVHTGTAVNPNKKPTQEHREAKYAIPLGYDRRPVFERAKLVVV